VALFFPLGFPVGHATLEAVLQSSVLSGGSMGRIFVRSSLYLCQSARLGLAKLTGNGESRNNIDSMNLWSEKECSSETAQFLTAPTSESIRSMIVWQVLVMKVGTLPLLHNNDSELE